MILKCFIGLLFISCVVPFSARGLIGSKECAWGPTHWCKNITNAKNCHAVKHCIQTVWVHQKVPEDNGDICSLCKNMVQDARDQLMSNETLKCNSCHMPFEVQCTPGGKCYLLKRKRQQNMLMRCRMCKTCLRNIAVEELGRGSGGNMFDFLLKFC